MGLNADLLARVGRAYEAGVIPTRPTLNDPGDAPHPKQLRFLGLDDREVLYGGAAGGGKSDALLMGASLFWDITGYSAIIFRRTHTDLAQPGALLDRSHAWWSQRNDCAWDGTNKIWRWASGAKIALAYMSKPNDHLRYQGAEYQFVGFDELTQFPEHQYRYVGLSRMRRLEGVDIPLRLRGASNPGGPGHVWVKQRYMDDPEGRIFIPAKVQDNPSLDQRTYIEGLEGLHPTVRAQLLAGDWDARDPGDYFRLEWVGPLMSEPFRPDETLRIRWWDLAATEKTEDDKGASARTAGVLIGKHMSGLYQIQHADAFRLTPGRRDDRIIQQAQMDGRAVVVGIEQEPGSGGIAQAESLQKRLKKEGYRCVIERATGDKMHRADPFASELERGWSTAWQPDEKTGLCRGVRMVAGAWTQEYVDEVSGFPEAELKDLMDASSGGFEYLRGKAVRGQQPVGRPDTPQKAPAYAGEHFSHEDDEGGGEDGVAPLRRWHRARRGGSFHSRF